MRSGSCACPVTPVDTGWYRSSILLLIDGIVKATNSKTKQPRQTSVSLSTFIQSGLYYLSVKYTWKAFFLNYSKKVTKKCRHGIKEIRTVATATEIRKKGKPLTNPWIAIGVWSRDIISFPTFTSGASVLIFCNSVEQFFIGRWWGRLHSFLFLQVDFLIFSMKTVTT